jgi:hypothetical protein
MRNFLLAVALMGVAPICGFSSDILFQGTLEQDDLIQYFRAVLNSSATVTIQSYGYAGGTALSTVVPSGGFAPDVTIFTDFGSGLTEVTSDNGGHCGTTNTDPTSGNCDDPFIQTTLDAGVYVIGLSVWDNTPVDGSFASGYTQTSPGFTCAEGNVSGNFCDVTDAVFSSRTGNWALEIAGFDESELAPEPSTWALLAMAGGALVWFSRRHLATQRP